MSRFLLKIGLFAAEHAVFIVLFWLVLALCLFLTAPSLSKVGVTDESQFLPHGAESVVARDILHQKFPEGSPPGRAILVLYNSTGWYQDNQLDPHYSGYVDELTQWLDPQIGQSPDLKNVVKTVTSVSNNPDLKDYLVSSDNTTMLINLDLTVSSFSHEAENAVKAIHEHLENHPQGIEVYATGEAPISADILDSVQRSVDRTTVVTILLVVVMLFLIYRSPVAALVPLATIGISYLIGKSLMGFMADGGLKISTMVEAYTVVIVFGVGIDYCMFIISRYREDMAMENSTPHAVFNTMSKMAPVIAASATTVVIGFLALMISHFGMDKTLGPCIAIAVIVTLLVSVTLVPALLTLLKGRLFWLGLVQMKKRTGRFSWDMVGKIVARHPLLVAPPLIILLLLPYIALPNLSRTSDMLTAMKKSSDSVRGYDLISEHFGAGQISPTTVVLVSSKSDILQANNLKTQEQIAQDIRILSGVDKVRTAIRPLGDQPVSELLLGNQLQTWSTGLATAANQLDSISDPQQLTQIQLLPDYLTVLPSQYPDVSQQPAYSAARDNIQKLQVLVTQINESGASPELLAQIKAILQNLSSNMAGLASYFEGQQDAYFISQSLIDTSPALKSYLSSYFSSDGTTAKFEVILKYQPYTNKALDTIGVIRHSLKDNLAGTELSDGQYYVAGQTAEKTDVMDINSTDFIRVMILALVGVYIVISLLLRSIVAPIYMILTVALNFGAALGISSWVFNNIFNYSGINYMVPSILFVVLVAVGADYNIFLVSRIREESRNLNYRDAVQTSVTNTGGVITACGLILAGTFAALSSAPFQIVLQVGVAVAIGVMLDTFIVRALVVPAIAAYLGKWNWWPMMIKK